MGTTRSYPESRRAFRRSTPIVAIAIAAAVVSPSCDPYVTLQSEGQCATAEELQDRARSLRLRKSRPVVGAIPDVAPAGFSGEGTYAFDLEEAIALKRGRDGWREHLEGLGFERGYVATWRRGAEFVKVEVFEFGSHRSALELQAWTNGLNCPYANETFVVPEVAGSIGFQVRWSGDFTNDQVSFVRGSQRFVVIVGNNTNSPPPRAMIDAAVEQLANGLKHKD